MCVPEFELFVASSARTDIIRFDVALRLFFALVCRILERMHVDVIKARLFASSHACSELFSWSVGCFDHLCTNCNSTGVPKST